MSSSVSSSSHRRSLADAAFLDPAPPPNGSRPGMLSSSSSDPFAAAALCSCRDIWMAMRRLRSSISSSSPSSVAMGSSRGMLASLDASLSSAPWRHGLDTVAWLSSSVHSSSSSRLSTSDRSRGSASPPAPVLRARVRDDAGTTMSSNEGIEPSSSSSSSSSPPRWIRPSLVSRGGMESSSSSSSSSS